MEVHLQSRALEVASEVKGKSAVSPCLSENQFLYYPYLTSCQASVLCQSGGSEMLAEHLSESLICILPDMKRSGQVFGDSSRLPLCSAYVHFPLAVIHLIVAFLHQIVYISDYRGGYWDLVQRLPFLNILWISLSSRFFSSFCLSGIVFNFYFFFFS